MLLILFGGRRFWLRMAAVFGLLALLALLWGPLARLPGNPVVLVTRLNKLLPVYSVDIPEKKVAISFDACWGAEYTDELLAILSEYRVKTTFFLVNIWVAKYPDRVKKIVAEGHELGLHSTSHPDFTTLSEQRMVEELQNNRKLIEATAGFQGVLFRPPFGAYNNTVIQAAEGMGLTPIQWSVDSLDWKQGMNAETIYQRVTKQVHPGAIVLFHNNGKYTARALKMILNKWQAEGYQVVPVSDLLLKGDTYVDVNGVQRQK